MLHSEKIEKKYGDLNGKIEMVELHRGQNGLGVSLAGNKDRRKMSVFVCGLHPNGSAYKQGHLQVGDEILEVSKYTIRLFLYTKGCLTGISKDSSLTCPSSKERKSCFVLSCLSLSLFANSTL